MCRQTAGSNAGTAKAHSRAWWKLPRRIWSILGVWSLANGRLDRPKNTGLCAAGCSAGTAAAYGHKAWWQLPGGALGMDALTKEGYAGKQPAKTFRCFLRVWRLANGRLERPKNRGYVQANGRLQRWNSKGRGYVHANGRLQHWNSTGLRPRGLVEALDNVKAMGVTKQVPHIRWSQAPPLPWRRPGSADNDIHIYIHTYIYIYIYIHIYIYIYIYYSFIFIWFVILYFAIYTNVYIYIYTIFHNVFHIVLYTCVLIKYELNIKLTRFGDGHTPCITPGWLTNKRSCLDDDFMDRWRKTRHRRSCERPRI